MKTARLFKNGQSQAVRLPKEYRFAGDKVLIKRVGNAVVLLPEKGSGRLFSKASHGSLKILWRDAGSPVGNRERGFSSEAAS